MTITTTITDPKFDLEQPVEYPVLRRWSADSGDKDKVLVVLFTSLDRGVPLAGVSNDRIGKLEEWVPCTSDKWSPCSIYVKSKD